MKKGWKVFWIICSVILVAGIGLCIAGVSMGANLYALFDVLEYEEVKEITREEKSVEKIPGQQQEDTTSQTAGNLPAESAYTYEGIKALDADVGGAALVVEAYDGDVVKVDVSQLSQVQKLHCRQEGSELEIEAGGKNHLSKEDVIKVLVPKNLVLREANFDVGAGVLQMNGVSVSELDISVGAGMVECTLPGGKNDYNYSLECGIGSINLGGDEYSGIGQEQKIHNQQRQSVEIECGVGQVTIQFAN